MVRFHDEVVQLSFLWGTFYLGILHIGGADSFVGLLRSFGLGGEVAVVYVTFAHQVGDGFTAGVDGKFGKVDGVGTHIGYLSRFVQPLGYHHGLCYCKS